MRTKGEWLPILGLLLIVSLIYLKSLNFQFLWVDHAQIEEKMCIIDDFNSLRKLLLPILPKEGKGNYYRPLVKISYSLDYLLFGLNPKGYRSTNLCLHLLNICLVYLILLKLGYPPGISFPVVLLLGLLPINTSTVALVGARADLLCAFFILLSFFLLLTPERKLPFYLSCLFYLLALLSKETAFPYPLLLLIWFGLKRGKDGIKRVLPFFLILIFGLGMRLFTVGRLGTKIGPLWGTPYQTLLSSFAGFFRYIWKTFLPINLGLVDAFPRYRSLFHWEVALGILSVILLMGILFFAIRVKLYLLVLGLSWLFTFYLPISNVVPPLHFWAERFFYLSSIGLGMCLGYLCLRVRSLIWMMWILIPLYACLTYNYLGYYKEDFTLFGRAIKVSPFCKEAHAHLGYAYLKKGNYAMAIYHYHQATQTEANFYTYSPLPEVYNNLGVIFLRLRQYGEAEKWFREGLKLDPTNEALLANLNILKGLPER